MSINQAEKKFFDLLKYNQTEYKTPPTLAQLRVITQDLFNKYSGETMDVASTEIFIKGRDNKTAIRVHVFNPEIKCPVIFFLPGTAFLFHLFDCHLTAASRIAYFGKAKVIVIDYRVMPENPWPKPIEDIVDVIKKINENSRVYNVDPHALYLSGICSGAHAAALVALQQSAEYTIQKLVLLNGLYDQSLMQTGYESFEKEDAMINRASFDWWFQHYKITPEEAKAPLYSPLFASNFSNFPETSILVAEHDGFRSDSEAFYTKLISHGVISTKTILPGQTHNTLLLRGAMTEGIDPAKIIADEVLEHFYRNENHK